MPNEVASVTENWLFNWKRREHGHKKRMWGKASEETQRQKKTTRGERKKNWQLRRLVFGLEWSVRMEKLSDFKNVRVALFARMHISFGAIGQLVINYHCTKMKKCALAMNRKRKYLNAITVSSRHVPNVLNSTKLSVRENERRSRRGRASERDKQRQTTRASNKWEREIAVCNLTLVITWPHRTHGIWFH